MHQLALFLLLLLLMSAEKHLNLFSQLQKNITKQILLNKLSNLFSLTQIKLKTAALKRIAFVCVCLCLQNCDRVEEENVNWISLTYVDGWHSSPHFRQREKPANN